MTLVIALEVPRGVLVACDSFLGTVTSRDVIDAPKWFKASSSLLVGYAGSVRAAQVAERAVRYRRQRKSEDDRGYLQAVVEAIREAHHALIDDDSDPEAEYLLAYRGRAYTLQEGYGLTRSAYGFAAIGAASAEALSALHATADLAPRTRAERVMQSVGRVSQFVCEPYHYVVMR